MQYAIDYPAHGQARTSNQLRKQGIFVSWSGVRSIWPRHDLACFKKRLCALEEKIAKEGITLTEAQVTVLERKKNDDQVSGEIETEDPGYLGSQDTLLCGDVEGCSQDLSTDIGGHLFQGGLRQAVYDQNADHSRRLAQRRGHELPMLRILTNRGTEYCGKAEQHDYQLYLALNDVEHTKTKVNSPQTNGIFERFHKTILQEFYQIAFGKNLYTDLESLQRDLDEWVHVLQ